MMIPTVLLLNHQLLDATHRVRNLNPVHQRIYLNSAAYLQTLRAPTFSETSLMSVSVLGWNKRFYDDTDYRTLLGTLVRNGKQYGRRDHVGDQMAVRALAVLATIVSLKIANPMRRTLLLSPPSSPSSTNTLPRQLVGLVNAAAPTRFDLVPHGSIRRVKDIGQLKELHSRDERLQIVRNSVEADASVYAGKSVLLIDDVLESGGTLREAARALRTAGALDVHALTMETTRRFAWRVMHDTCL